MINLYIDFDGVLVDTINETYKMMADRGISLSDSKNVGKFYRELDWNDLLLNTQEINDAFKNIRILQESKIFNISILTTVHSINEIKAKVSYIRSKNKNIPIICVPKGIEKCDIVNPLNSILVDDYGGNLKPWIECGGLGIKFTSEQSDKYITINSLDELLKSKSILRTIQNSINYNEKPMKLVMA